MRWHPSIKTTGTVYWSAVPVRHFHSRGFRWNQVSYRTEKGFKSSTLVYSSELDRFDTEKDRNLQKSSDMDVVVVSIVGCGYCRRVKDALERHNIRYKDIDLTYRGDLLDTVKGMTGKRTVPMVFVNGRLVGGASEVMELLAESPDGTEMLLEDGVQYDLDALLSSASSDSGHGGESQSTSLIATMRRLKEIRDAYRNQNSKIEDVSDILDSDVVRDMFKYHILVEEDGGLEWSDAIPIVSGTVDRDH
eukprot:jgi/Picre1/31593/NNA_006945.t1